jgi:hypothetical protein
MILFNVHVRMRERTPCDLNQDRALRRANLRRQRATGREVPRR